MFEEREIPMDALLGILAIEKLRYDNGVKFMARYWISNAFGKPVISLWKT